MRSDAAFPWAAFLKAIIIAVCSILFLGAPLPPRPAVRAAGHSFRDIPGAATHTSIELTKVRRAAGTAKSHVRTATAKDKRAARGARGQQVISSERAGQIQSALIREHFLDGEASGVWDQRTKDAMIRYQAENGWQTKITPNSRALIKLGLGPRHEGLLNPDSAALGSPHELGVNGKFPADTRALSTN